MEFVDQWTRDQISNAVENISTPSREQHKHVKQSAKEELNAVFQVRNMYFREISVGSKFQIVWIDFINYQQ